MKRMTAIGALLALFSWPVLADDMGMVPPELYGGVKSMTGKVMEPGASSPATNDTFDFGFDAQHVRICIRDNGGQAVYFRLGHTVVSTVDTTTRGQVYVPSGDFISDNGVTGAAIPMHTQAASSDNGCVSLNVATPGITMYIASGQATADVWAFPSAQRK